MKIPDLLKLPSGITRRQLLSSAAGVAVSSLLLNSRSVAALFSGDAQSDVDSETVQFSSGNFAINVYVVKPKVAGKYPAVIVVHDDQGLQDNTREAASKIAAAGFVVIAPDLLSRIGGTEKLKSSPELIKHLSVDGSIQDLNSVFTFAQKHPSATANKISAIGFGWGGWRTFSFAANQPDLRKATMFCGTAPEDGLADIQAECLAHYAQLDFRVTGNLLWTEKTLKAAGKQFTSYVYDNVDHGFYDPSSPKYNAAAANLAWSRTIEFLKA